INTEKLQTRLIMQVHDELVLEVPDGEVKLVTDRVPELMSHVADLRVPLLTEVGLGSNWDEAH
ncbi:MAG TPA: DNA polymerase, partial [Burkholderiaceae bacterium]|nr:DNA polymerase [Burkholderiaceae bacterium]